MKCLYKILHTSALLAITVAVSCNRDAATPTPETTLSDKVIKIGYVSANGISAVAEEFSKAKQDAVDSLPWLIEPLKQGFDVKYYWDAKPTEKIAYATLQLKTTGEGVIVRDEYGLPVYNFLDKSTGSYASWFGNGNHTFQGSYPPEKIRVGSAVPSDLATDQHNDSQVEGNEGNYTLLERYLAIPSGFNPEATTTRVSIPYSHRLARAKFLILINPEIIDQATGQRVKIKGYQLIEGKDDPTTTAIRFKKVQMLKDVKTVEETPGHNVFCPEWTVAESVIPHFVAEVGSISSTGEVLVENDCILFYNQHKRYYVTPGMTEWKTAYDAWEAKHEESGYTKISYGKVPCYDLLVRPTYSTITGYDSAYDHVMYDEEGFSDPATRSLLASNVNAFQATIELSNGLSMVSSISVDLNADYQANVYVRIELEKVDVEQSVSEKWSSSSYNDKHYGTDSDLKQNLSRSGSSWQRAFRVGSVSGDEVSDSHTYNEDGAGHGQYLQEATWLSYFKQAVKGGNYHGYYFILSQDITINTDELPANFVFTGHLDALGHKITLTGAKGYLFDGLDGTYTTAQESDMSATWEANVHKEKTYWVPVSGYRAEVTHLRLAGGDLFKSAAVITGYVDRCVKEDGTPIADHIPEIPTY